MWSNRQPGWWWIVAGVLLAVGGSLPSRSLAEDLDLRLDVSSSKIHFQDFLLVRISIENKTKGDIVNKGGFSGLSGSVWMERMDSNGEWSKLYLHNQGHGFTIGNIVFPAEKSLATYEVLFYNPNRHAYTFDQAGKWKLRACAKILGTVMASEPVTIDVLETPMGDFKKLDVARKQPQISTFRGSEAANEFIAQMNLSPDSEYAKYVQINGHIGDWEEADKAGNGKKEVERVLGVIAKLSPALREHFTLKIAAKLVAAGQVARAAESLSTLETTSNSAREVMGQIRLRTDPAAKSKGILTPLPEQY